MRIIKMIKWLLNHPPVGITSMSPDEVGSGCKYCGAVNGIYVWYGFSYCYKCLEKVMDKVLNYGQNTRIKKSEG